VHYLRRLCPGRLWSIVADGAFLAVILPAADFQGALKSLRRQNHYKRMGIVGNAAFPPSHLQLHRKNRMAIKDIKAFSDLARTNPELKEKLVACQKIRELLTLAKEYNFNLDEQELYPPNEPQFTAEQFSERLVKALLRA
jgi:predicted ribosomally synthesized peptide with nif11-like leader